MSVKSIITGHLNELFPKERIETIAKGRLAICEKCSARRASKSRSDICSRRAKTMHVNGHMVSGCGCRLEAKTRVPNEECPAGKWGPVFE